MDSTERERSLIEPVNRFTGFQQLMRQRVNEILLVSSLYDSYILAQDGQIQELLLTEYMELNLHHSPGMTRVPKASEALWLAEHDPRFNLVLTTTNVGDMRATEFAHRLKEKGVRAPVVLLTYDNRELEDLIRRGEIEAFDHVFLWQGDFRILLAIIKLIEDSMNAEHDTRVMGVQTILLVEDNIRFYSSYLPMIYTELVRQSQSLIDEGMNMAHQVMRMRARPKILLATKFENAWDLYLKYEKHMLGVITDIEYEREGEKDPRAGAELVKRIRKRRDDIPILLQSFQPETAAIAKEVGVPFVRKDSRTLLSELRHFMLHNFGFGDFIFMNASGQILDRAHDLKSLEEKLHTVPDESIVFHAERDHFSNWLKARTEFAVAERLKPRKVSEFSTVDALRQNLIDSIREFRHQQRQGIIADFKMADFDPMSSFARIGGGSLGGKARGLAFLANLINTNELTDRWKGVHVATPASAVLSTDIFDEFLDDNDLREFALQEEDGEKIRERFLAGNFPMHAWVKLRELIQVMTYPLAVRSSGLLEDSHYQPFAGIYDTFMIPNNHPDIEERQEELIRAIKLIYASTFSHRARAYIRSTPYRLEEEKMAVIVQRLIGLNHHGRYYPDFSGVGRSHNFYPTPPATSADGIANVALGIGTYVVEGREGVRFCPKYPRHTAQFGTVEDMLNYSQKEFYTLDMPIPGVAINVAKRMPVNQHSLDCAEEDGTLNLLGSVYSHENGAISDGLGRDGTRLVSFAPILKHRMFPLADILKTLLEQGERGMSRPVELEFAANVSVPRGEKQEFYLLQMRPLVLAQEVEELKIHDVEQSRLICRSNKVLGIGMIDDIRDVVMVNPRDFDRSTTREVAQEVAKLNAKLLAENRPYLLIGIGRWGSMDPWLGIPVEWDQINGVRVIIETGFNDFKVQPSEGAHFFHNITSLSIGYFTVNPDVGQGNLDWDFLLEQKPAKKMKHVRLLRFDLPLVVMMNGHKNQGIIFKPGMATKEINHITEKSLVDE
ncbi:MAG: PEP/pyruvate-binding domain-containing protein [bacterium]